MAAQPLTAHLASRKLAHNNLPMRLLQSTANRSALAEVESAFAKELRTRGISSPDDIKEERSNTRTQQAAPNRKDADAKQDMAQLERSRKLNSEGIEGLFPRASVLLRIGVTFFLGFWPIGLLIAGIFFGLWGVRAGLLLHPSYGMQAWLFAPFKCALCAAKHDVGAASAACLRGSP